MGQTPRDRRKALWAGIFAEHLAILLLGLKGYRILAHRFATREGEIDLVAQRGDTLAFIEVKIRPTLEEARLAIDAGKRRRISRAVRRWLAVHPWASPLTWRGDAILVAPWCWPRHAIGVVELDLD
ncbi:MAG TPA: YraN family protein [Methylocella sp.]|nr:YraN family protein [Methylocella sp.]